MFEQLNPNSCRTYLIGRDGARAVMIVDPVLDHLDDYLRVLDSKGLRLTLVADTHTHADHISAGAALVDATGCKYLMYRTAPAECVTERVRDFYKFLYGEIPVNIAHTPGHTEDSICLVLPDRILTGDTLFLNDAGGGRDDLSGGDSAKHWHSIQLLSRLPDSLVVYPAHEYRGAMPSTLGEQKRRNPFFRPQTQKEFARFVRDFRAGPSGWMKDIIKSNYACATHPGAAWIPADVHDCALNGAKDPGVNAQTVQSITADELIARADGPEKPVILDVRGPDEMGNGNIRGARNIPVGKLVTTLDGLRKHRSDEIITVCHSGRRSHTAAQILKQAGFEHVHYLAGGMTGWERKGFPVETR